jgi:hypothetical protein
VALDVGPLGCLALNTADDCDDSEAQPISCSCASKPLDWSCLELFFMFRLC